MTDPVAERDAGAMAAADALMDSEAAAYVAPDDWRELAAFTDLRDAIYALALFERQRGREESRWQPIETAPRDGTPVLLAWADSALAIAVWQNRNENLEADTYYEGWVDQFDFVAMSVDAPTYWMPLPAPPRHPLPIDGGLT